MQENSCAICFDKLDPQNKDNHLVLSCQHAFHGNCIANWFITNQKTCPQCRKDVFDPIVQPSPYAIILKNINNLFYRLGALYSNIVMVHMLFTAEWPLDFYALFIKFIFFRAPLDYIDPWLLFEGNTLSRLIGVVCVAVWTQTRCYLIHRSAQYIVNYYLVHTILFIMIYSTFRQSSPLDS